MNRREAMKNIMAFGALCLAPQLSLAKLSPKPQTHFIGVGSGGCQIVQYFYNQNHQGKFTCIAKEKPNNLIPTIQYFPITKESGFLREIEKYPPLTTDYNRTNTTIPVALSNTMKSNDRFALLTGLGGFSGSRLTKELIFMLHHSNKDFKAIVSLPFHFEGEYRQTIATKTLNKIKHLPEVCSFEMEYLRQKYSGLTVNVCFEKANLEFWEMYNNSKNE